MLIRQLLQIPGALIREKYSQAQIERMQNRKIEKLIEYVYHQVPWYRQVMDERGLKPGMIRTTADLQKLPVLTKDQVRQAFPDQIVARGYSEANAKKFTTSGTSGKKMELFHDWAFVDFQKAQTIRRFGATKAYQPWYKAVHIKYREMPRDFYEKFGLFRRLSITCLSPVREMIDFLVKERPDIIISYPSHLCDVLRTATKEELAIITSRLKAVHTESEQMTPERRKYIEDMTGVEVFDDYSSFETLALTYECHKHRAHLAADHIFAEVVRDGQRLGTGETGEILITTLNERAMPLIRYQLGDLVELSDEVCPCGRQFPVLTAHRGRIDHSIILADGSRINSIDLIGIHHHFPEVRDIFFHQLSDGAVRAYLLTTAECDRVKIESEYKSQVYAKVNQKFPLEFVYVDRIPRTPEGKYRFLYSEYHPEKGDKS